MIQRSIVAACGLLTLASPALAQERTHDHSLILTGVGRFAVFADAASVTPDGKGVRMRAFQVSEPGFAVGDQVYWGGWSWWRFDCAAQTADRLDFASVKAGGQEGPATPDPAPPYAIAPGGDAAELAAVACAAADHPAADATTIDDAVRLGHARLTGASD
ncbi:hypothetical protein [Brevundimonas sp.]|uniref:hypothetical protein n=1 Tax=Brevundimonas sp. TaxID=1871086 RepID=UPI0025BDCE21|nr:hypothetical protein [Brevundimonas sp.]